MQAHAASFAPKLNSWTLTAYVLQIAWLGRSLARTRNLPPETPSSGDASPAFTTS
jgi:hypothetical protein